MKVTWKDFKKKQVDKAKESVFEQGKLRFRWCDETKDFVMVRNQDETVH